MNITEYRAMKAEQERAKLDAQTQRTDNGNTQAEQTQATQVPDNAEQTNQSTPNSEVQEPPAPEVADKPVTVEIDGKELTLDELKNGYLRQSDYTRKTQEARRKEQQAEQALKLLEELQKNPQVAQQLSTQINVPELDPTVNKFREIEDKYYDLLIQTEMRNLHDKYGDFEEKDVLEVVMNEKIENLDTAYHIMKSRKGGGEETKPNLNMDEIKAQLREELLKELSANQATQVDTSTIIQTNGSTSPVRDTTPQLSQQELKVARMMGMNSEEYAQWRDIKKK